MILHLRRKLLLAALLTSVSCGGSDTTIAPPSSVVTISMLSAFSIAVGTTFQLVATVTVDGAPSTRAVTYTTDNAAVASVTSTGVLNGVSVGTATITGTVQGTTATARSTITVNPGLVSVIKVSGDSTVGPFQSNTSGPWVPRIVQVRDQGNKPVANVSVTFALFQASGTLNEGTADVIVTSDANGFATLPSEAWYPRRLILGESSVLFAAKGQSSSGSFTHTVLPSSYGFAACELSRSGVAYCAGTNTNGALGDGTTTNHLLFAPVSGGLTFTSLASGAANHHCALTSAGQAYCWGQNSMGEIGDGTFVDRNVPTPVVGGLVFTSLYTQASTSCGITTGSATYCWGFTGSGGWGAGDLQRAKRLSTPTIVNTGGLTFRKLALMDDGLCGITASGVVACLGLGYLGTNGDGSATQRNSFATWSGTWSDLDAGNINACALDAGGRAYCVGAHQNGATGIVGGNGYALSPGQVGGTQTFSRIYVGNLRACGVTAAGAVYCWGLYPGNGATEVATPTLVSGLVASSMRMTTFRNTCAKIANGQIYCWGRNSVAVPGVIGDNTLVDRFSPTAVIGWPDGASAGVAASISLNTPSAPSFSTGSTVTPSPSVTVTDRLGAPVAGVVVTFTAVGGGSVGGGSVTTNANGIATVGAWTLPSSAGKSSLDIATAGVPTVTVQATITP